ncbi:MAG: glutathione S-transferase family protein [Tateyamaria sp.]|uniref:glutathione S-transferase family protein n=1 Tax=Tateyamaria sp. TaxID=1929288 RepID=UPI0032A060D9
MHLFGRTTSVNVQKVLWTLEELKLAYERTDLGGAYGGLGAPDYVAMNPNQRVPTLIDGDLTLWESNTIVRYLVSRYGQDTFAGSNPAQVALADMWMEWFQNNCYPHFIALFYQTVRLPKSERSEDARDNAAAALSKSFALLDKHLEDHAFVAGRSVSMGDFIVGASLYRYFSMDFTRADLPNLSAYYDRLCKRAAYRQTIMTSFDSLRPKDG